MMIYDRYPIKVIRDSQIYSSSFVFSFCFLGVAWEDFLAHPISLSLFLGLVTVFPKFCNQNQYLLKKFHSLIVLTYFLGQSWWLAQMLFLVSRLLPDWTPRCCMRRWKLWLQRVMLHLGLKLEASILRWLWCHLTRPPCPLSFTHVWLPLQKKIASDRHWGGQLLHFWPTLNSLIKVPWVIKVPQSQNSYFKQ